MNLSEKAAKLDLGTGVILWQGEIVYYAVTATEQGDAAIEARIVGKEAPLPNTPELLDAIEQDLARSAGSPV